MSFGSPSDPPRRSRRVGASRSRTLRALDPSAPSPLWLEGSKLNGARFEARAMLGKGSGGAEILGCEWRAGEEPPDVGNVRRAGDEGFSFEC